MNGVKFGSWACETFPPRDSDKWSNTSNLFWSLGMNVRTAYQWDTRKRRSWKFLYLATGMLFFVNQYQQWENNLFFFLFPSRKRLLLDCHPEYKRMIPLTGSAFFPLPYFLFFNLMLKCRALVLTLLCHFCDVLEEPKQVFLLSVCFWHIEKWLLLGSLVILRRKWWIRTWWPWQWKKVK